MKHRACRECGEDFSYDWSAEPFRWYCDTHTTRECAGEDCVVRLPRRSGLYCSTQCRSVSYAGRGKKTFTDCPCGKRFGERRRYCSEKCRIRFTKVGDRLRNNPALARQIGSLPKPNHGLKGYRQTEEHLVRRLGNGSIKPSREELSLVPALRKLGFRHTGDGAFWRRWPDGTLHNPDFVDEANRRVVEYFGSYWHEREEENYAQQQWESLGYECRVIWDVDREAFLAAPAIHFGSTRL